MYHILGLLKVMGSGQSKPEMSLSGAQTTDPVSYCRGVYQEPAFHQAGAGRSKTPSEFEAYATDSGRPLDESGI
jgi:hypothetical protein